MADDVPPIPTCRGELAFGLLVALAAMTDEERGGRAAHSIADWLMDAVPDGLAETRALLGENRSALEPYLSIVETFQEIARRLFYIGRVHSADRSLDWETRLLWDFTSAIVRDLNETARAVVLLASQGIDAPAKVLLRHGMELYGRELAVLRDEKERALYLRELQRLRDFQAVQYDSAAAEEAYRSSGLVGGALMDRVAEIEQNLDESSLPSRGQANETARLLRDLYAYFSNLTHVGPELVDDVLYVYDPSFPSRQRRRAWGFGEPTRDSILTLDYLTMLLWQFWRMVPRALERSGLASPVVGDVGIVLLAARGLEQAVVQVFDDRIFGLHGE
jgi:hypothetical protein